MKGTILNTATVGIGGLIGWKAGAAVPLEYKEIALHGLGLVVVGLSIRMFLSSKNVVAVAAAIALGGILGLALGFQHGIEGFSEWARVHLGGETGTFNDGLITTSVLFCVGPMTLLGCLQDGIEGKSELLVVKSTMDGVAAFFFAAALGPGVVVTAGIVLIVQGAITLAARPLRKFASDTELMDEAAAAGGAMLLGTALSLLEIKVLPVANYLPALFLAPLFVAVQRKWTRKPVDI